MKTFKLLGLLLTYPDQKILDASEEILEILQIEALLSEKMISKIKQDLISQKNKDFIEIQEVYVETFDRGRAYSLHLFEHVYGESRDRGQAMVDLSETYASKGMYIQNNELPDYLPLFMEYLSQCSFQEARELLGEAINIIAMIGEKLKQYNSPYRVYFEAIEMISGIKPNQSKIMQALKRAPKNPKTAEELDEEWKEAEVFGQVSSHDGSKDCTSCNHFSNTRAYLDKMSGGQS